MAARGARRIHGLTARPLLAGALAAAACAQHAPEVPASLWASGDLLIVDADAGAPTADGSRAGMLFASSPEGDGWSAPRIVCDDPRLVEPVDVLPLDDGAALVLESS